MNRNILIIFILIFILYCLFCSDNIEKFTQDKRLSNIYGASSSRTKNDEIYPVSSSEEGTAVISGFSEQLLKVFMKYDDFNPEFILNEILEPYIKDITTITDIKDICDFYKNDITDNDANNNVEENQNVNKTLTLGDMMRQYFYKK